MSAVEETSRLLATCPSSLAFPSLLPVGFSVLSPSTRNEYFHIHNQKPPTDDINVRKAILHAINIDEMIEKLLGDDVVKAIGPIPYSMWGHDPNLKTYEYDPAKAREYLKKSKYAVQMPPTHPRS